MLFTGPGAHQGSTPIKDPRIPGITPGGDFSQPPGSRPHREILVGAMVVVAALAVLATWLLFKPAGSDAAARASAVQSGLIVPDEWDITAIDGGFTIHRALTADKVPVNDGIYFDIVATTEVPVPADASTWKPQIVGATAYAEGDPEFRVLIDTGDRHWVVIPRSLSLYAGGDEARAAWYDLANSISFPSAK